jgi:hypothetical protein
MRENKTRAGIGLPGSREMVERPEVLEKKPPPKKGVGDGGPEGCKMQGREIGRTGEE